MVSSNLSLLSTPLGEVSTRGHLTNMNKAFEAFMEARGVEDPNSLTGLHLSEIFIPTGRKNFDAFRYGAGKDAWSESGGGDEAATDMDVLQGKLASNPVEVLHLIVTPHIGSSKCEKHLLTLGVATDDFGNAAGDGGPDVVDGEETVQTKPDEPAAASTSASLPEYMAIQMAHSASMGEGMIVTDEEGVVLDCHYSVETLFGPLYLMVGHKLQDLLGVGNEVLATVPMYEPEPVYVEDGEGAVDEEGANSEGGAEGNSQSSARQEQTAMVNEDIPMIDVYNPADPRVPSSRVYETFSYVNKPVLLQLHSKTSHIAGTCTATIRDMTDLREARHAWSFLQSMVEMGIGDQYMNITGQKIITVDSSLRLTNIWPAPQPGSDFWWNSVDRGSQSSSTSTSNRIGEHFFSLFDPVDTTQKRNVRVIDGQYYVASGQRDDQTGLNANMNENAVIEEESGSDLSDMDEELDDESAEEADNEAHVASHDEILDVLKKMKQLNHCENRPIVTIKAIDVKGVLPDSIINNRMHGQKSYLVEDCSRVFRAEKELQTKQELLQAHVNFAEDACLVLDANTKVKAYNKSARDLLSDGSYFKLPDITGRNIFDLARWLIPKDMSAATFVEQRMPIVQTIDRSEVVQHTGGKCKMIEMRWHRCADDNANIESDSDMEERSQRPGKDEIQRSQAAYIVILLDKTENWGMESKIEEIKSFTSIVNESCNQGVISADSRGKLIAMNGIAERVLGYTEAELLGKDVSLFVAPPYNTDHPHQIRRFLRRVKKIEQQLIESAATAAAAQSAAMNAIPKHKRGSSTVNDRGNPIFNDASQPSSSVEVDVMNNPKMKPFNGSMKKVMAITKEGDVVGLNMIVRFIKGPPPANQAFFFAFFKSVQETQLRQAAAMAKLHQSIAILNSIMNCVVVVNTAGIIDSVNDAVCELFEFTREELHGRNMSLLLRPADKFRHEQIVENFAEEGNRAILDVKRDVVCVSKKLEEIPVSLCLSEIVVGEEILYVGILDDIRERNKVQEALIEKEAQMRKLVEDAVDGIMVYCGKFEVMAMNKIARNMFGLAENDDNQIPSQYHEVFQSAMDELGGKEKIEVCRDMVIHQKDGNDIVAVMKIYCHKVAGDLQHIATIMSTSNDIVRKKEVDLSNAIVNDILWSSNAILITIDRSGSILHFNETACKNFGYEADQVIGKNIGMLMPEPYASQHDSYVQKHLASGRIIRSPKNRVVRALRADGESFSLSISLSQVTVSNRDVFTAACNDVSDKMALEEQNKFKSKRREMLFSRLSDAIMVIGLEGKIRHFTENAVAALGLRKNTASVLETATVEGLSGGRCAFKGDGRIPPKPNAEVHRNVLCYLGPFGETMVDMTVTAQKGKSADDVFFIVHLKYSIEDSEEQQRIVANSLGSPVSSGRPDFMSSPVLKPTGLGTALPKNRSPSFGAGVGSADMILSRPATSNKPSRGRAPSSVHMEEPKRPLSRMPTTRDMQRTERSSSSATTSSLNINYPGYKEMQFDNLYKNYGAASPNSLTRFEDSIGDFASPSRSSFDSYLSGSRKTLPTLAKRSSLDNIISADPLLERVDSLLLNSRGVEFHLVVESILSQISSFHNWQVLCYYQWSVMEGGLVPRAIFSVDNSHYAPFLDSLRFSRVQAESGFVGKCFSSGEPIYCGDVSCSLSGVAGLTDSARDVGLKCACASPVAVRETEEVIGVFAYFSDIERPVDPHQTLTIVEVAARVASASITWSRRTLEALGDDEGDDFLGDNHDESDFWPAPAPI